MSRLSGERALSSPQFACLRSEHLIPRFFTADVQLQIAARDLFPVATTEQTPLSPPPSPIAPTGGEPWARSDAIACHLPSLRLDVRVPKRGSGAGSVPSSLPRCTGNIARVRCSDMVCVLFVAHPQQPRGSTCVARPRPILTRRVEVKLLGFKPLLYDRLHPPSEDLHPPQLTGNH